jgi:two-component sensor histidine kinase
VFRWRERGVPIQFEATKKGFGSQIIEHILPYALDGTAQLTFHSDGAECASSSFRFLGIAVHDNRLLSSGLS